MGGNASHPTVTTTGTQQYGDGVGSDQTTLSGNIFLKGTIITFNSTVDAASPGLDSLNVLGSAVFNALVGDSKALKTVNVTENTPHITDVRT